ncbi:MAG: ATP-dependent DNA helicase [Clostridia bacterium]|nr:ATP-dependent DNA helicase [Clostridia bacterium]
MRFDRKTGVLRAEAGELIMLSLCQYALLPEDAQTPKLLCSGNRRLFAGGREKTFVREFSVKDATVSLSASANAGGRGLFGEGLCREEPLPPEPERETEPAETENGNLCFLFLTEDNPAELSAYVKRYIRGYAFLCAYVYGKKCTLRYRVESSVYPGIYEKEEKPSAKDVEAFFAKVRTVLEADACRILEKNVKRLPTMAELSFPFPDVRSGQKDMMEAVYAAAAHGKTLFATAPTGTGKTLACLFPAVKAMGRGLVSQIFYFTPKTTSQGPAKEAIRLLAEKGAKLLGVGLEAKEKLCRRVKEGEDCYDCPLRRGHKKKEDEATEALLNEQNPVIGKEELLKTAAEYGVCPYELSLRYAQKADIVVGDYNYLFDPKVYLRRFFDCGGEYAFLFDEAHNLPDRAREMYSGELTSDFLRELISLCGFGVTLKAEAEKLKEKADKVLSDMVAGEWREDENGEKTAYASRANLPWELYKELLAFADEADEEIKNRRGMRDGETKKLRLAASDVHRLCEKMSLYDDKYVTYALATGESYTLRFYCIDPSDRIAEKLDKGKCAVFFSATLAPAEYYRSVLCGNHPALSPEVPSPLDSENLCVGIMDKVSVRALQREDTLPEIARIIATAMKEKPGNYMVFCPSFSYMERVAEAFHRLVPKVPYVKQKRSMTEEERQAFLCAFAPREKGYFVGFCVTGGIYGEGVDLAGNRLIGTVIIGMGLPGVSAERELIASYYEEKYGEGKAYAYFYPGFNRILQAAGRVIRTETDKGVVILVDDRFRDPLCRRIFPDSWRGLKFVGNRASLTALLNRFWGNGQQDGR